MNGTITKKLQGFGFITRDGQAADAKDLFFHSADLSGVTFDEVNEGDKVTFDEDTTGPKGPAAKNVTRG